MMPIANRCVLGRWRALRLADHLAPMARAAPIALIALAIRAAFVLQFSGGPLFDANLAQGAEMEVPIGWARRRDDRRCGS